MLQMVDEGRTPAHWAARNNHLPARSLAASSELEPPIQIALINNMPDPALEDTESQFFDLLEKAAGRFPAGPHLHHTGQASCDHAHHPDRRRAAGSPAHH